MFVLFGINTRTKQPERVTQNASAAALRRMWSAYTSAAIGDLDGDADDVEVKPGTDRTHVAALTRAIVRAQRGDVTAHAEPAEDRNAKPANVPQPAPLDVPVEEIPDAVPIAPPRIRRRETPVPPPPPAVDESTLPAHAQRRSRIDAPCPVPGCDDRAAPYLSVLPEPLRALCARHRTHAQRLRAGGSRSPSRAVEMVMEASRPAPPPPAAEVKDFLSEPAAPTVDPRMVADAPGPQVELTDESTEQITARLRAAIDDAASAGGQVLRITNGTRVDADPLAPIFDRLDAVAAAATAPSDALTRADFAAVLRELRGALRVALDVAIARLESPR